MDTVARFFFLFFFVVCLLPLDSFNDVQQDMMYSYV